MNFIMTTPEELTAIIRRVFAEEVSKFQNQDRLLTTAEVVRKYGIHSSTLRRWHQQGLPYIKGCPNRYRESELMKFFITRTI